MSRKDPTVQRTVRVQTSQIVDEASFHLVLKDLFGFPSWYEANMDAWIDCMSYLDDPERNITGFELAPNEVLVTELVGAESFVERSPRVFSRFIGANVAVSERYREQMGEARVLLTFL